MEAIRYRIDIGYGCIDIRDYKHGIPDIGITWTRHV